MSYLVLARKWRPRRFAELVGQEHVVRALSNALDSGRVHHAFLFTGTRGVGKTTIARIFAKSLNCETGVGAEPCGTCNACQTIDAGRFIDLIEIDAASNTGVDDIRDVIENAQYMPTSGRYKVYLIDEVHMLTRNAFNALLKTLEEPPEHVKFLLATTDPQKLPVTVLSRCLQFNLKRLTVEQIALQITSILAAEEIEAEPAALQMLARAADGSLRDGLSLLDQAIAFGGGALTETDVRSMLGAVDHTRVGELLEALVEADGNRLLQTIEQIATFAPDFGTALDALAEALHRLQLAQLVPGAAPQGEGLDYAALAARVAPELVQLWYQMATSGRRDLPYAPSERIGFEMSLLRMLAFVPAAEAGGAAGAGGQGRSAAARGTLASPTSGRSAAALSGVEPESKRVAEPPASSGSSPGVHPPARAGGAMSNHVAVDEPAAVDDDADNSVQANMARLAAMLEDNPRRRTQPPTAPAAAREKAPVAAPAAAAGPASAAAMGVDSPASAMPAPTLPQGAAAQAAPVSAPAATPQFGSSGSLVDGSAHATGPDDEAPPAERAPSAPARLLDHEDWLALIGNTELRGPVRELAHHAVFDAFDGVRLRLALDARFDHLRETATVSALQQALESALGHLPQIHFTTATRAVENETLHQRNQRERDQRQIEAEAAFHAHPEVQRLVNDHGARIVPGSIRPSDPV